LYAPAKELPLASIVPRKIASGCCEPTKRLKERLFPLIVPDTFPPAMQGEKVSVIVPVTAVPF
jgi:hypothetical protein